MHVLRLWTLGKGLLRWLARRPANPAPAAPDVSPWVALRSVAAQHEDRLSAPAETWLAGLPDHAQPRRLAARHPRIVNRLAELWADRHASAAALDSLAVDERGGRGGFSPAIRAELMRLQFLHRQLGAASEAPGPASAASATATVPQADPHHTNV